MKSAPLKWHGGKTYLASKIISLFPKHAHYVEPFFGGGAVFFSKPDSLIEGHSEVINDRYYELINFWRVLRSETHFPEFVHRVRLTPFSKPDWEVATRYFTDDPVASAVDFFVRYRQSRQGLGKDFATLSRTRTRRGMNEQVSAWLSAVEGLPEAHQRLSRVVIYNEDAVGVIRREDGPDTLYYLDPPYISSTRVAGEYACEMTDGDHKRLLETLGEIEGKFILSGYDNPLYEEFRSKHNWNRVDIEIDNKASAKKEKDMKTECLWRNYQ